MDRCKPRWAQAWLLLAAACGPEAGEDGSRILLDYGQLRGGVVFASRAVPGSNDYDLYWAPVPAFQTAAAQPLFRLTEAGGNEWQPSVSAGNNGIAYARSDDGIYFIAPDGRINQVAESGRRFADTLPAVSADGAYVAWVRADTERPVAGFFESFIMLARTDGSQAVAVQPIPGIVQDAPVFEPVLGSTRLAWSEFDPSSVLPPGAALSGPQNYRVWVHDFADNVGFAACASPAQQVGGTLQRCFGQHLAWPRPEVIVVTQSFLEIYLDGRPLDQVYSPLLNAAQGQVNPPIFQQNAFGYQTFPIAASYAGDRMVFDGYVGSVEGNPPTLGLWVATVDGSELWRLNLNINVTDNDPDSTAGYLFSVATPQIIP